VHFIIYSFFVSESLTVGFFLYLGYRWNPKAR